MRRDWVWRILGVALPGSGPGDGQTASGPDHAGIALVRALRSTLDQQVIALQDAFGRLDDARAAAIVRGGITPLGVRLHQALDRVAAALEAPAAEARTDAVAEMTALQAAVASDPGVAYLERNPFGIPVAIRAATAEAATELAQAMKDL